MKSSQNKQSLALFDNANDCFVSHSSDGFNDESNIKSNHDSFNLLIY